MYNAYTSTCLTTCETGYSPLKDALGKYYCGVCTSTCNSCSVSSATCTSCVNPYFLYSATCITKENIPDGFYGNTTARTADSCLTQCTKCVSSALCTACISTYFLYQVRISIFVTSFSSFFFVFPKKKDSCISSCPDGMVADGSGSCKESTSSLVSNLSDNSKVVPFPMLLACIVFGFSVYFSKYEYN